MNIIVIVSDTLRRDHIGAYGNDRIVTPDLNRFAQKAFIFDRCYAASFPTVPARADLFTGKLTFTYMGWQPLPQNEISLAQLLQRQGYSTTAIVDTPFLHRDGYGYDRGFENFTYIRGQRGGPEMDDVRRECRYETDYCAPATFLTAERWLQQHHKEKFFLYIDTWDPHEPWDAPDWYTELYLPNYDGRQAAYPVYGDWRKAGMTKEDLEIAHACYCGEVTMVDRWFGRFLDTLELLGIDDQTAVIFTSDHGFYFGEHGYFGKAVMDNESLVPETSLDSKFYRSPLYGEVARVPLIVYAPSFSPGRSDALASLSDVTPTVLELAGAEIPGEVHGKSLTPIIKGEVGGVHDCVVTSSPLFNVGEHTKAVDAISRMVVEPSPSTITTKDWALLYASEGEPVELYHLTSDPGQEKNLFDERRDVAEGLLDKFTTLLKNVNTEPRLVHPRKRF